MQASPLSHPANLLPPGVLCVVCPALRAAEKDGGAGLARLLAESGGQVATSPDAAAKAARALSAGERLLLLGVVPKDKAWAQRELQLPAGVAAFLYSKDALVQGVLTQVLPWGQGQLVATGKGKA